ncbi:MAG: tRNA (N(6)-L-threonylcarbamoyladenosine(37)-C(2))-methylthiotransferase MtaB [Planctomycetota bacterium]|nr:tRNA (N(6)-L-threonylcarbamoyladenosine(37)-C(2))-methylthiotransferase MtaB [Planctomycetota bacterium]
MPSCAFITFGCKINQYDTQAIREEILDLGYVESRDPSAVDLLVVNSCTVTERAGEKVGEKIRSLTRKNPAAKVIVTGCISEDDRIRLEKIPEVVHLIGNEEKHRVAEVLQGAPLLEKKPRRNSRAIFDLKIHGFEGRTRAFLKIQDGCDSFCSYCIIPYLRGGSRSRDHEPVLQEARRLVEDGGFRELVLTGIHLRQWGLDRGIEDGLARLMLDLRQIPGLDRVRLSSIGEGAFTDAFLGAFQADSGLCRFFHVPLQSGSERILRRMRRDYTIEDYVAAMERVHLQLPGSVLATDVIVGFPGETEEDFQQTLQLLEQLRFVKVHLFPYSPRPRTRAARLDDHVPVEVREQRMIRVRELCQRLQQRELERRVGDRVQVLIEKESSEDRPSAAEGLSREGIRVQFEDLDGSLRRGTEVEGILEQRNDQKMSARIVAIGAGEGLQR